MWEKAVRAAGPRSNSNADWGKDACGAWIRRGDYGRIGLSYAWKIGHIRPVAEGGNGLENLQLLQWENNESKEAGKLDCVVTSQGTTNVKVKK